jgi:hypothetical protein
MAFRALPAKAVLPKGGIASASRWPRGMRFAVKRLAANSGLGVQNPISFGKEVLIAPFARKVSDIPLPKDV